MVGGYARGSVRICNLNEQYERGAVPQVARGAVHDLRHEALISDPKNTLKDLCGFLGLNAGVSYYADCASIIFKSSHKSRSEVEWNQELIDSVNQQMSTFPFLAGYAYDD